MGQQLAHVLRKRHCEVILCVRDPSTITENVRKSYRIVVGDATDSGVIKSLLQSGIHRLVHTVSVPLFHTKPTSLYSSVTQAVIDAWQSIDHQCEQYVVMSSAGTHHGRQTGWPWRYVYEYMLGDVADDKEREEKLLQYSQLPWTVIKAVLLTNAKNTSYQMVSFDQYTPSIYHTISRVAVAHAIADSMDESHYHTKKVIY